MASAMLLVAALLASDEPPKILARLPDEASQCTRPGAVCFFSGASTTARSVQDQEVTLSRGAQVAAKAGAAEAKRTQPWDALLVANLKKPTVRGTVLFVVYDKNDPEAIKQHEVTQIWYVTMPASRNVAARVQFDPDDGFNAGHSYLLRVVQIIGKREQVLAEGAVKLE